MGPGVSLMTPLAMTVKVLTFYSGNLGPRIGFGQAGIKLHDIKKKIWPGNHA